MHPMTTSPGPQLPEDTRSLRSFQELDHQQGRLRENSSASAAFSLSRSQSHSVISHSSPGPGLGHAGISSASAGADSLLNVDIEGELAESIMDLDIELRSSGLDAEHRAPPRDGFNPIANATKTVGSSEMSLFEPWGEEDVFDVFDLELVLSPGEKDASIDIRYRHSSSSSSSGRPTYKISKKTRPAHFLAMGMGKKNMSIDVARSIAWDVLNGAPASGGHKGLGYSTAFTAKDQPARAVALRAANSILSKSTLGPVLSVSNVCGPYDACSPPATQHNRAQEHQAQWQGTQQRQSLAHHYFLLRLNDMGVAPGPAANGKRTARGTGPTPTPANKTALGYEGGGYFIFSGSPPQQQRTDLITTLYCTGYEQRPHPRPGDVVVAELRLRPAAAPTAPAWARFFKERHAAVHISRRGLAACMSGSHVRMDIQGVEPGQRAVLSRGQAIEVVLTTLGTALLAIEHDGSLATKRWAWLAPAPSLSTQPPRRAPALALDSSSFAPSVADDPGLASPEDGPHSGSSDDSQGPPTASISSTHAFGFGIKHAPTTAALAIVPSRAGSLYTPSISERELMIEEWMDADADGDANDGPGHPHPHQRPIRHLSSSEASSIPHANAPVVTSKNGKSNIPVPAKPFASTGSVNKGRSDSPARMFGGTWRRSKSAGRKESANKDKEKEKQNSKQGNKALMKPPPVSLHRQPHSQQQLAWPEKSGAGVVSAMNVNRQSVMLLDRDKELPLSSLAGGGVPPVPAADSAGFTRRQAAWPTYANGEGYPGHAHLNGEPQGRHGQYQNGRIQMQVEDEYVLG
ncbi:hypothetical protein C8F01DRAFT_455296 [Mycena amicta]|nr:hypothetical protein C8F01DRAFT_455296 [Mycena amicta]